MTTQQIGVTTRNAHSGPFSITVVGLSLSVFLVISYLLCLIGYLVFPELPIYHAGLAIFLPGFKLLIGQQQGGRLLDGRVHPGDLQQAGRYFHQVVSAFPTAPYHRLGRLDDAFAAAPIEIDARLAFAKQAGDCDQGFRDRSAK